MTKKFPLRVFHNDVMFQFEDESTWLADGKVKARGFKEKTDWGFVFTNSKDSASNPRWGIVVTIGPDVDEDIFIGKRVLIENLKWTEGVDFEGHKYWKTTDEFILCVDDSTEKL